jgi:TolB-like protein/DNA-binding winged helix-turn-helix (wHTH) protein
MQGSSSPPELFESGHRRLRFAGFVMDLDRAALYHGADEVKLRPKSFEVLRYLALHPGRIVPKTELIPAIWPETFVTDNALVQCLQEVRRALGDEAQELVKTVARRGYLFEAEVIAETPDLPGRLEVLSAPAPPAIRRKPYWPAVLAVILVVAAVSLQWFRRQAEPDRIDSVAVLPFQGVGDASRDEYLELGVADAVITRLSTVKRLTVRATSAVRPFTGSSDPITAGRRLGVGAVVEGTVQRVGERIRVSARLIRIDDGRAVWADSYDQPFGDIFSVEDAVSSRIAAALSVALTGEEAGRMYRRYASNTEAYQLYIRGRYFWEQRTPEGLRKAVSYFEQAIDKDPRYAPAYAGLANAYGPMLQRHEIRAVDALPKMVAAAAKALELDPDLPDAHIALGATRFNEWNYREAERETRRAIELNPNDPLPHMWYGYYLGAVGRHSEQLAQMQRGRELDPLNVRFTSAMASAVSDAGRPQEALEIFQKIGELDPTFRAPAVSGKIYAHLGRYGEALVDAGASGDELELAYVQALAGQPAAANKSLAHHLKSNPPEIPLREIDIAAVYAALAQREDAFRWLDAAYREREPKLIFLNVDYRFAALRQDPRFSGLVSRIHAQNRAGTRQ